MTTRKARGNLFAGVFVTLSVALVGTAFGTGFEPANAPIFDPKLIVTPSDGLTDGQVVSVDGMGFGGDQTGVLRQCTEDRSACSATTTPFTSGRNGQFGPFQNPMTPTDPPSVPVNFTVRATFTAEGTGPPISCVPSSCIIDAISFQVGEIRRACHHITFGIVDTTPCTQPASATSSSSSTSSTSTSTSTTSTTIAPTTSTSTTLAATTTTLPSGTTTTVTGGADRCAALRTARAQLNAQIDQLAAVVSQQFTDPTRAQMLAQLEQSRTAGNASIDQASSSCSPSST